MSGALRSNQKNKIFNGQYVHIRQLHTLQNMTSLWPGARILVQVQIL